MAVNKVGYFWGRADVILKCTPPKFNSLPLKSDGLKFEDYITFLLGPGNFSGANRETSGV